MRLRSTAAVAAIAAVGLIPAAQADSQQKPKKERCSSARAPIEKVGVKKVREAMVCIVNFERTKRGLPKLKSDKRLDSAAQSHSRDMEKKGYFDHTDPQGDDPGDRISDAGYKWSAYGENIYLGPDDAYSLMKGWMSSSGHCNNILSPSFRDFGFGIVPSKQGALATQDFGTALGDEPASDDEGPSRSCPQKLRYR